MKKIVSASRRCDLLAHRPGALVERVKRIGTDNIGCLVIWTKDPTNLFEYEDVFDLAYDVNMFVHFTVTGLGGTILEPGVPPWQELVGYFDMLTQLLGTSGVAWRFDPLIRLKDAEGKVITNMSRTLLEDISKEAFNAGVKYCYTSTYQPYAKAEARLKSLGLVNDTPVPQVAIPPMAKMLESRGFEVRACGVPGWKNPGCINGGELAAVFHEEGQLSTRKDKSQRGSCTCTESEDIGDYIQPCLGGCLYCYANPKYPLRD